MQSKSKKKESIRRSPPLNTCKSGQLPPTRPLASLSLANQQFYSDKQIHNSAPGANWPPPRRPCQAKGENFATADESSNAPESNLQESLCFAESRKWHGTEGKEKIESTCNTGRRGGAGERMRQVRVLEGKLREMRELFVKHDVELRRMRSEMKEGQLYRLLKMHSIQKARVLENCSPNKLSHGKT